MKILMTGFDAFGTDRINPSSLALELLKAPDGVELIRKPELSTVFGIHRQLEALLLQEMPQAVICVGQAGGRSAITVERAAINVMDASIADNAGFMPRDLPVIPGGPDGYLSTLPIKKMVQAMVNAGIPAQVSNTAGTFVCNSLLYGVLHLIRQQNLPIMAGFIHLPFLPEQTAERPGYSSMALSTMVSGLEAALQALKD